MTTIALRTEREATRCSCPFYPPIPGPHGEIRFITCRAAECMAWRWAAHSKIENREPRPTGFCGRVEHIPPELFDASVPEVLPADAPSTPPSVILK